MDKKEIQEQAYLYRDLYRLGKVTREEAKEKIMPYLDFVNETSKKICKKYNQKHRNVTFSNYVR